MALKDYFEADNKIFFNSDEFSTEHEIDGVKKTIQLDEQKLKELSASKFQGMSAGEILYYIPVSLYGTKEPCEFDTQNFDGKLMYINSVSEDHGVYEIVLSHTRGE